MLIYVYEIFVSHKGAKEADCTTLTINNSKLLLNCVVTTVEDDIVENTLWYMISAVWLTFNLNRKAVLKHLKNLTFLLL